MRVLMLGWEFPPFISGGLGTACYGLTKALSRQGVEILFVLPKSVDADHAGHVRLISPISRQEVTAALDVVQVVTAADPAMGENLGETAEQLGSVIFKSIPSRLNPYKRPTRHEQDARAHAAQELGAAAEDARAAERAAALAAAGLAPQAKPLHTSSADYSGDVLSESQRYARMCLEMTRGEEFDVIHAHDWMTFPAGQAIAAASGKPLIVHVHSTEFDRAGESVYRPIYEIERRGMHAALTVICVSHLTATTCISRYDLPAERVQVVYNGIDSKGPAIPREPIKKSDKIVLFLGRVTMQKGPEYFIAAARKVLEKVENVKFVVAGAGDMIERVIQLANEMGIGHKVLFTGFLRGKHVDRVFRMADVYVMPSVSEPFGIAPLEAIRHDVPVIISRNSGVAEVVQHALKVDFWDVDDIANKIVAVLRHPPLSQTLREHADIEVRALTWDGAATSCVEVYQDAIESMNRPIFATA